MLSKYRLQFPPEQEHDLAQDEAYFNLVEEGTARKVLFHEYDTGFSRFIRELIFSEYLDVYQLERYSHRLSMEGVPLKYFALVGRLTKSIPNDFLQSIGVVD